MDSVKLTIWVMLLWAIGINAHYVWAWLNNRAVSSDIVFSRMMLGLFAINFIHIIHQYSVGLV